MQPKPETMIFPHDLSLDEASLNWWIIHTKPNQEKKISDQLKLDHVPHFLPLIEKRKKYRNKTNFLKIVPLFPSYLFFAGQQEERWLVLQTGRTANVIPVLDQDRIRFELKQVYQALQSGLSIDPLKKIKVGTKCKLISGPGMGLEGKVIRVDKKYKLIIEIQTIGQSFLVEVSADDLAFEPEGEPKNQSQAGK